MGVNISYMGTKKETAAAIAEVVGQAQAGPMLDAFSGMCSVGEMVGTKRQIWTNDIQIFSSEVGAALFTSGDEPLQPVRIADLCFEAFAAHRESLCSLFGAALKAEESLLESRSFAAFGRSRETLSRKLAADIRRSPRRNGNLFVTTYAENYFGVKQAIEIDSIVHAIGKTNSSAFIRSDHRRWLTIGLGRALLRCANSTGHFAQFLKPKRSTYKKFMRQRRRSLWTEWLSSADEMSSVGTAEWRKDNRSFNRDSLALVPRLASRSERPAVIYADPPYTDDQYSRYYHVLETLVLYDYPSVTGAGLYRPERFRTPFSIKSEAAAALDRLIRAASRTGSDFILSYPTNGLVYEAGSDPEPLLRKHFRKVERCFALPHSHSTFGASKGAVRASVTEQVFLARS